MFEPTAAETALEIEAERQHLRKAEVDIDRGVGRLRSQRDLLDALHASGGNTIEAERLARVLEATLGEWQRHRALIEQRLAYLRARQR